MWNFQKRFYGGMKCRKRSQGAFHLSELTGQPIPIVMRISLLINNNHPDQSNPTHYAQRRWFFSKTSWKTPLSLPKCLVWPWSGRPVLTYGKRRQSLFFFSLPLIFSLHWWPLAFLILSPLLQNFHVVLPTTKCLQCFFSLSLDLCRPFSRWVSHACHFFSFSLSFSCSIQGFWYFARSRTREIQVFPRNPAKFPKKREIPRNPPEIFPITCRQNIFNTYLGY